ncbi:N-acetyltransferase family protein [Blautia sp. HCP3S3_H10_1]|uniref:GNAT family N-acetyltransferase n=1 Tax=unclassified Blautia TaxID=2648079 RepID=UPI003F91CED6|nr:GNAT family N-acetyltransferase [Clostridia bacterium]
MQAARNSLFIIERAQPEEAAALLDYLRIIGRETDNLSFGAEGVPLSLEAEQDYLRSQCESTDNVQYFAKVNGEIIGTASLNRRSNRMSHRGVFGISLKKAWWGCGAASALMEAILAFAKENGFEQLNLEVRSDNARAIHLYEKYGFRKLCTFPNFFKINGEPIDFDLMNLELNTDNNKIKREKQ